MYVNLIFLNIISFQWVNHYERQPSLQYLGCRKSYDSGLCWEWCKTPRLAFPSGSFYVRKDSKYPEIEQHGYSAIYRAQKLEITTPGGPHTVHYVTNLRTGVDATRQINMGIDYKRHANIR